MVNSARRGELPMPIANRRWREVRVQWVWLVMCVQGCHVCGGRGGGRGVASGSGGGCSRGVMIIGRVYDARLRRIVMMVRGRVAQRLALTTGAKHLLLLLLSVEEGALTSLPQSVFHLLLDGYSVVLVGFDNVLRAFLEESLDHGIPTCQVIVGVVSQSRL